MPKQTYETLFLLDPTKVSADADGVKQQLHTLIERHGGHVDISRPWDYNHKLTYPIGKSKKGSFHIIYYTFESTSQAELERDFALQEGLILRQLTSKLDPKWKEEILRIAREDTGNGFALRGMQDEQTVQTDPSAIGGDVMGEEGGLPPRGDRGEGGGGPRRGRRDMAEKPE
ncbi:30s ribosomal protein s6 : 30S ribosomal protein S6 OS=Rhodopirellula baltica SWK14 GN=rpsF PE=3 SV=1: Ribosomal_S6 [Gemmata massiliana]|uniref:Small ribosomal subunit protein bS6 n=1 Tax=Gemmata massiliana TaxID=1210884 RepID=A0A6P2CQJ3_9BACT|nr:30S ribosomal protein S6 [Gemmata massiliana]VTR91221.1 30s ribosomal protein s6 : 30S ribosomal protein S6 OS=Rhodopirellula baltica SWK14 GN=rpsF PE=3 SV=1: Ribosomal_S6 [Gemmata massiliana]